MPLPVIVPPAPLNLATTSEPKAVLRPESR